jgi:prophage regulatory protein
LGVPFAPLLAKLFSNRPQRFIRRVLSPVVSTKTPEQTMQLLKLTDVTKVTSLGRSTIYRRIGEGTFPAPLRLSAGCVRWDSETLESWKASLKPANDNRRAGEEAA